jgi:hypothetical protein
MASRLMILLTGRTPLSLHEYSLAPHLADCFTYFEHHKVVLEVQREVPVFSFFPSFFFVLVVKYSIRTQYLTTVLTQSNIKAKFHLNF